jgi:amino acid transporter
MVAAAILTAVTYILPLSAMALAGLSSASFSTGDWADAARQIGGSGIIGAALALAVVAGGCINGVGMFNALGMSYTRLPMVMAEDRMLPSIFARRNRRGVPWVSVLFCSLAWALALNLPFERLISIDLILYGTSLILEFAALVALRIREPELPRPFRAGSFSFACLLGVGPTLLIAYALYASRDEKLGAPHSSLANISALAFASVIALLGPALYALTAITLRRTRNQRITAPDSLSSDL